MIRPWGLLGRRNKKAVEYSLSHIIVLSHSLAHLAVPYGGRQDARLKPIHTISGRSCVSSGRGRSRSLFLKSIPHV
jgi:hypothetical protein